jgi:predicted amidohydrolase
MADSAPPGFVAAAVQLTATADLRANLNTCRELCRRAADRGASLVVLPECFAYLGESEGDKLAVAEIVDPARPGPILEAIRAMARDMRVWLVAGGLPERMQGETTSEGAVTRVYNTALVLSPEGEITATYRKIHLFDIAIPGRAMFRESESTAPGNERVVAETPLGRLGLSICYDLRFPELYRDLAVRRGADVLIVSAAFTAHTGAAHWHTLLRARAIENQCYVIAAAQTGRHNPKRETYGHSLIIDPWGTVIDEVAEGVGIAVATIDPAVVEQTRAEMPCLQHQTMV